MRYYAKSNSSKRIGNVITVN